MDQAKKLPDCEETEHNEYMILEKYKQITDNPYMCVCGWTKIEIVDKASAKDVRDTQSERIYV